MTSRIVSAVVLALSAISIVACSGNDSTGNTQASGGAAGIAGFMNTGTGGMPAGGAPAGGAPTGGATPGTGGAVAAGQLMCGGKVCHAGGHCAKDGTCPAFLGACFTNAPTMQTCNANCAAAGFACAEKSCNADGTAISGGYTSVSYAAANMAMCQSAAFPDTTSFDACAAPIWLSSQKPLDDVIRCCCKD